MFSGQLGKFYCFGFPAAVLQGATIRWFAFYITREFDFGSGKTSFKRDFRAFVFGANGHYVDVTTECFAAAFVDDAHGRADFGIGKCGNVLLEKVDESAFTLKQGEEQRAQAWGAGLSPVSAGG